MRAAPPEAPPDGWAPPKGPPLPDEPATADALALPESPPPDQAAPALPPDPVLPCELPDDEHPTAVVAQLLTVAVIKIRRENMIEANQVSSCWVALESHADHKKCFVET